MNALQYGFFDELEKIASQPPGRYLRRHRKTASVLGLAGLGALTHLGTNAIVKGTHHTKPMQRLREGQLATGLSRAITGAPQSVRGGVGKVILGPELWANQDAGAALRPMLSKMSRRQQYKWLKKVRRAVQQDPKLAKLPFFEDAPGAINQLLQQPLPRTNSQAHVQPSMAAKVAPGLAAAGFAALEPSSLVHTGINVARSAIAKSEIGKKFFKNQAQRAAEAVSTGQNPLPAARTAAMDYGLSPRALDSARITAGLSEVDPRTLRRLIGLGMPLGNVPGVQAAAQQFADKFNTTAMANQAASLSQNPQVAQASQVAQPVINPALQQVVTRLAPPDETARFLGGMAQQAGTMFQRPIQTVADKLNSPDPNFPKAASRIRR